MSQPLAAQTQNDSSLIDVTTLQQMNAIRWDLNGDGVADSQGNAANYAAAFATTCTAASCNGYELLNDLDFNTGSASTRTDDLYWNNGLGWEPIGARYNAVFRGNGYFLENLYINRPQVQQVGLFANMQFSNNAASVRVEGIGLVNADVTGGSWTGGILGYNSATLAGSFVTGKVTGSIYAGCLAGGSVGLAVASYADCDVDGGTYSGGLIGNPVGATIRASYSRSRRVSGLAGGLAGTGSANTVTDSYWDSQVSGLTVSVNNFLTFGAGGGSGTDTAVLQMPTTYTGIYAAWNVDVDGDGAADDPWRFGTFLDYPVLRGGGANVARQFLLQPQITLPVTLTGAATVAENGAVEYTVRVPFALPYAATVRWSVGAVGEDGAEAGDFADDAGMRLAGFPTGTATISAGSSKTTFSVYVFDDRDAEYAERFSVSAGGVADAGVRIVLGVADSAVTTTIGFSDGIDYDTDDDNLIDVRTTTQLEAIRYDLDGVGLAGVSDRDAYLAAFPFFDERRTCPSTCTGYELSADLDLSGIPNWKPIGGGLTQAPWGTPPSNRRYQAVFEGNGHVISNITIRSANNAADRFDNVGFFGAVGVTGRIRNVGLNNVHMDMAGSSVGAGALVGYNAGKVAACYVVGDSRQVRGGWALGGLVGRLDGGVVIASYADVRVHQWPPGESVGGLIGGVANGGIVSASYAVSRLGRQHGLQGFPSGGLVGDYNAGTIQTSYFDEGRSGQSACCGSNKPTMDNAPRTSAQLRVPTMAAGTIYEGWDRLNVNDVDQGGDGDYNDDAPWDFGSVFDYPVLVFGGSTDTRQARRTSQQQAQPAVVLTPTLGGSKTVSEGEAATYVVRLPGVLPAGIGASWDWSVGGTGIGVADFGGTSRGSVVIAPGGSSASFSLTVAVDGVAELDEAFEVTMSNARLTGAPDDVTLEVPGTVARTTIAANELEQVTVAVAPAVVAEGTTATFTVSLSSGADRAVTVEYELAAVSEDLTAGDLGQATVIDRNGTNYVSLNALPVTGSITLRTDGSAEVGVSVVADEVAKESNERFRLRLTNCPNCGSDHPAEIGTTSSAEARIRSERGLVVAAGVYLEGAYRVATGDMGTFLNRALPRVQPYNVRPWNHAATTTVPRIEGAANANGMPSNVVDWMLLELRVVDTGSAPSAADPDSVPAGGVKAGLLLSDGSIAGVNENATTTTDVLARQGVRFDAEIEPNKDVYLLLQHRNHLPILSARPLSTDCGDSGANYCVDYREVGASADLYNGSCPMFRNNDRLFMITGDVNADGTIVSADAEFADEALRRAISLGLQATNNPASFRILRFRGTEFYMPSANVSLDELLVSSDFDRVLTQLRRPSGLTRGMICRSSGR